MNVGEVPLLTSTKLRDDLCWFFHLPFNARFFRVVYCKDADQVLLHFCVAGWEAQHEGKPQLVCLLNLYDEL